LTCECNSNIEIRLSADTDSLKGYAADNECGMNAQASTRCIYATRASTFKQGRVASHQVR
jgi:hypothetical protein